MERLVRVDVFSGFSLSIVLSSNDFSKRCNMTFLLLVIVLAEPHDGHMKMMQTANRATR